MSLEKPLAIIYTEGKTDWQLLKKAREKLNLAIDIEFYEFTHRMGDDELLSMCRSYSRQPYFKQLQIFVFDRDNPKIIKEVKGKDDGYKAWENDVYSFPIPIPEHRVDYEHVSIEFYFTDEEIKTTDSEGRRLFLTSEFDEGTGSHKIKPSIHVLNQKDLKGFTEKTTAKIVDPEIGVVEGTQRIALSKGRFTKYICDDVYHFDNFNFESFQKIFDVIKEIIQSSQLRKSEPARSYLSGTELLHIFKPIDSFMNLGDNRKLFQNNLLFFTEEEKVTNQEICDSLLENHCTLLLGNPASGKTITACEVASKFQKAGFQVYYHSFKYQTLYNLWDDIHPILQQKILFIIDDCHFDMEHAGNIYRLIYDLEPEACFLFISRDLAEDVQRISKLEFNLFDELKERTFTTERDKKEWTTKIEGIIRSYQRHFQRIHKKAYQTGIVENITTHVHHDLLALSFYLNFWETSSCQLSDIDKKGILKEIYGKYWKDLKHNEKNCLLHYASLYYFEIEFESFHEAELEKATQSLAEKGILLKKGAGDNKECYAFYHSSFSMLLIDAYISENHSLFKRKDQGRYSNFLFRHIRDYILAFEEFSYPVNLSQIILRLFTHDDSIKVKGQDIAKRLCLHKDIKRVICQYYLNEVDNAYDLTMLFAFLSQDNVESIRDFFDELIFNNVQYKTLLLHSEYPTRDYYALLNILSRYPERIDEFSDLLTIDEKKALLYQSDLKNIVGTIKDLKSNNETVRREFSEMLQAFDASHLATLIEETNFSKLTDSLYELHSIVPDKSKEVFRLLNLETLVQKAEVKNPGNLSGLLHRLREVDAKRTHQIFNALDKERLLEKMENISIGQFLAILPRFEQFDREIVQELIKRSTPRFANKLKNEQFHNITQLLTWWRRIDIQMAQAIFVELDTDELRERVELLSFEKIGDSLSRIKKIDLTKTKQILQSLPSDQLALKAKEVSFANLGKALNEIWLIEAEKAREILDQLTETEILIDKAKEASFVQFTKALNEIKTINPVTAKRILTRFDSNELKAKAMKANFNHFGKAFNELRYINPRKSKDVLARIEAEEFAEKANNSENRMVVKVLKELQKVDFYRTKQFLDSLPYDDVLIREIRHVLVRKKS